MSLICFGRSFHAAPERKNRTCRNRAEVRQVCGSGLEARWTWGRAKVATSSRLFDCWLFSVSCPADDLGRIGRLVQIL